MDCCCCCSCSCMLDNNCHQTHIHYSNKDNIVCNHKTVQLALFELKPQKRKHTAPSTKPIFNKKKLHILSFFSLNTEII